MSFLEEIGVGPLRQAAAAVTSVVALSADLLLTGGDMLLGVSDLLFSITALAQGQLGAQLGFIDPGIAKRAFLAVAVLYLTHLLFSLHDRLTENDS
jgi:hypothetical protein